MTHLRAQACSLAESSRPVGPLGRLVPGICVWVVQSALALLVPCVPAFAGAEAAVEAFSISQGTDVISGEVHRLDGSEPSNALIVVGGSGVCQREDTGSAVPMFLSEATAVVLVDRRGCGASTGTFVRPATRNSRWLVPRIAMDVEAVAAFLRSSGFDRVVAVGSSFGGWVVLSAAAAGAFDAFVTINGGGSSVAVSDAFDHFTDQGMAIDEAIVATEAEELPRSYDPALDLKLTSVPSLWVLSELDDSNPAELDRASIDHWRRAGRPFEILVLGGVNHELIHLETGDVDLSWLPYAIELIEGRGG